MSFFQLISMALAFAKLPAIALEREVTGQRQPATAIGSLWWRPGSTAKNTHAVAAKTPFARGQPHAVRFTLPPVARCILSTLYPAFCSAARRCRHLQHVYCAQLLAGHTCLQTLRSHG